MKHISRIYSFLLLFLLVFLVSCSYKYLFINGEHYSVTTVQLNEERKINTIIPDLGLLSNVLEVSDLSTRADSNLIQGNVYFEFFGNEIERPAKVFMCSAHNKIVDSLWTDSSGKLEIKLHRKIKYLIVMNNDSIGIKIKVGPEMVNTLIR